MDDGRTDDDEPELAGYEPHDGSLRRDRRRVILRAVVIIGLVALILPGIIVTLGTANRTATTSCGIYVSYYAPEAIAASVRFELVGPDGPGWNCYVREFDGSEFLLAPLGLIPGGAYIPTTPVEST